MKSQISLSFQTAVIFHASMVLYFYIRRKFHLTITPSLLSLQVEDIEVTEMCSILSCSILLPVQICEMCSILSCVSVLQVCRGLTAVLLLQFLDLEQTESPVARERVRARVRHGVVIVEQF